MNIKNLFVIVSLLAVLALAVIKAIDPVERANRARDKKFQIEGQELISGQTYLQNQADYKQIFVRRDSATSSAYACFVPLSKQERDANCSDSTVYTLNADGTKKIVPYSDCNTAIWNNAWVICPGS